MRNLKLRCWTGDGFIESNNSCFNIVGDTVVIPKFRTVKIDSISQFTGILDEKGVEIYEGDIVEFSAFFWLVKFYTEKACFGIETPTFLNPKDKIFHSFEKLIKQSAKFKVIGNIFSKPHFF